MGETEYEAVDGIICPATSNVININKLGNKMATPPATPEAVEALARALSKHVEVPSTGFLEVDPDVVANNACFDIAEAILTGSITLPGLVPAAQVAEAVAAEREACAQVARHGCLVPPDGGSPSESEVDLCDHIATIILERGQPMPPFAEIRERGKA